MKNNVYIFIISFTVLLRMKSVSLKVEEKNPAQIPSL
jgi:hypothetical protein